MTVVAARDDPRPAVLCRGGHVLSHEQLGEQIEWVKSWLGRCGVPRGAVVALRVPSGPAALVLTLACMEYGVCAPIEPLATEQELGRQLDRLTAAALIRSEGEGHNCLLVDLDGDGCLRGLAPRRLDITIANRPGLSDFCLLLPTSGTTGTRKLVPHTAAAVRLAAGLVADTLGLRQQDRCLDVMPLHHTHGLVGGALSSLVAGASVVTLPGFNECDFVRAMIEYRPTWFTAVPGVHRRVAELVESGDWTPDPSHLRFARSASAPLSPTLHQRVEESLGVPLLQTYALTEAPGQVTAENPRDPREGYGCVGTPAGCSVRVVDDSGDVAPLKEVGRVQVRGDHVCRGYLEQGDQIQPFPQGWLETGDLGTIDHTGRLWLTGRINDVINRAGDKILPFELEEVLRDCPGVADVTVFGVPDEALGEGIGCAFTGTATSAEVASFARASLGRRVDVVMPVAAIPMAGVGKVDRRRLAELASATTSVAGAGAVEDEVARLWRQVLPDSDLDEHFLDAGGASLQGMQLELLIGRAFGVVLPTGCTFGRGATIRGMSTIVLELLQGKL